MEVGNEWGSESRFGGGIGGHGPRADGGFVQQGGEKQHPGILRHLTSRFSEWSARNGGQARS